MADIHKIVRDPLSQTEATTSSKIPALNEDGSNWVLYKAQFLAAVYAKGLRRYLEGTERVPQAPTAPGVDSDADERYETAVDKWLGNHSTIKTLLFQTVPESLKLDIATKSRANEAWALVSAKYDNQGDFVQVNILNRMHQLRCEEGGDPRPVLTQLARLRSEYATAGAYIVATDFSKVSAQRLPLDRYTRLIDSAASRHFDPCRENFIAFRKIEPIPIQSADGRIFHATGEGDVRVT
ncbi:hypothetical protein DICSQDRAFT_73598, partial [Dichomitus squalens LYAD-421 SS1]